MMGTIPYLAVYAPAKRCCFVGESFSSWPSDWKGCMRVFLWVTTKEPPRLLSLWVYFMSQEAWRDTITVLYVMDEIVWLPWRYALLREKEATFLLETFYFCAGTSLVFPQGQ